jgi:hypothetical protein
MGAMAIGGMMLHRLVQAHGPLSVNQTSQILQDLAMVTMEYTTYHMNAITMYTSELERGSLTDSLQFMSHVLGQSLALSLLLSRSRSRSRSRSLTLSFG